MIWVGLIVSLVLLGFRGLIVCVSGLVDFDLMVTWFKMLLSCCELVDVSC